MRDRARAVVTRLAGEGPAPLRIQAALLLAELLRYSGEPDLGLGLMVAARRRRRRGHVFADLELAHARRLLYRDPTP